MMTRQRKILNQKHEKGKQTVHWVKHQEALAANMLLVVKEFIDHWMELHQFILMYPGKQLLPKNQRRMAVSIEQRNQKAIRRRRVLLIHTHIYHWAGIHLTDVNEPKTAVSSRALFKLLEKVPQLDLSGASFNTTPPKNYLNHFEVLLF